MKYQKIYRSLKNEIAERRFAPTNRLPGENSLAARFKVARETIRRALTQLEREGLVIRRNGIGTFVTGRGERKTGLLGLLIPTLTSSEFFAGIKDEIENVAENTVGAHPFSGKGTARNPARRPTRRP